MSLTRGTVYIYCVCGATDFRKQTESLASLVSAKLDPYLQDKENDIKGNIGKMRFNTYIYLKEGEENVTIISEMIGKIWNEL